jgi:hypothetical protein
MIVYYTNMKTTIIVEESTRESLKEIGKKGESYDQIIRTLLKINPSSA